MKKIRDTRDLKSGTPFRSISRLRENLKTFENIITNWNGITCNCKMCQR